LGRGFRGRVTSLVNYPPHPNPLPSASGGGEGILGNFYLCFWVKEIDNRGIMSYSNSNRRFIEIKYRIAWYVGTVLCFVLYFLGIVPLYVYLRKRYLKRYIAVVLMYHRVSDDGNSSDITVSAKNFEDQILYLKKNFNIVSIDELIDMYLQNVKLEEDTVAITFDDGYKDNYTDAYPILRRYNVPAIIFVATGSFIREDKKLNEKEIKEMQKDNIIFGAHAVTHRVLSELDREAVSIEINDSKSTLERILQQEVKYFAYPYGKRGRDFTDDTIQIVKSAGFKAAFATDNGFITNKSDLYVLNRIGVRNFPLFVLKARLSGIFENKWIYKLREYLKI